jgi:SAM-dependent methyltransferase
MAFDPQDTALIDFYKQVHHTTLGSMPGVTTSLGKTSYQVLADCLGDDLSEKKVLDLACGDGEMIPDILAKGVQPENLWVMDASKDQIDRVHQRFDAPFHSEVALAQHLPLTDGCLDAVVCHMAFMLMRPMDDVMRELSRVLKSGGLFAAVIGRTGRAEGIDLKIGKLLGPYFESHKPDWLEKGFGDPRVLDDQGFEQYLAAFEAFGSLQQTPFKWLLSMSIEDYIAFLRRNYVWFLLKDSDKPEIEQRIRQLWQDLGGGIQDIQIPMRLIVFKRN